MKENYDALKMDVIAFEGNILTEVAPDGTYVDVVLVSGDDRTTGQQGNVLAPAAKG